MTLTITIKGYGSLTTCENTTNWSCATISGPTQEDNTYLQGSYAVSAKASNKSGELMYDVNTAIGRDLDFDTAGTEEGQLIYIWIACSTLGLLETLANNGLAIRLLTSSGNYGDWLIAGSDNFTEFRAGKGGFVCFAIDPTSEPSAETGTFDPGAISEIGIHIETTGLAKTENIINVVWACSRIL